MAQIEETVENLGDRIVSLRTRRNQLDDQAKKLPRKEMN